MIQITGGQWKGRALQTPASTETRPTSTKVRQALFNSIQTSVEGAVVLDLFAGSGALGLEALSRGASEATFVDHSRASIQAIRKSVAILACADQVEFHEGSVRKYLRDLSDSRRFDLIFADPPYALTATEWGLWEVDWKRFLKPDGFVIVEWGKKADRKIPENFGMICCREKTYGDTVLTHYRCKENIDEDVIEESEF